MKTYFYLIFIIVICLPNSLKSQIKLDVKASKNSMEVGETVEVNFIVRGSKRFSLDHISLPSLNNAQLLGNREQTNISYSNGESVFTKIISFVLRAQNEGEIIIPSVGVVINDNEYNSRELVIEVKQAKEIKDLSTNKEIFLDVELSDNSVYNQQPIIATVKLYSLSYDALRRRSNINNPVLNDFQVKNISNNSQREFKQEVIGDRVYVSEEVAKYQLIPQKSGYLSIPPFGITLELMLGYNNSKLIDIKTKELKVKVNSLPEDAPPAFNGAVGNFKINTYVDKKYLKTNETFQLEVELIGNGNLSSLIIPKLNLDKNFEVYEPMRREKIRATSDGEIGKIVNTYAIVPQYGGHYSIPALEFSYFDPKTEEYSTIQSQPIPLEIEGKPKPKEQISSVVMNDSIKELNDDVIDDSLVVEEEEESILNIKLPNIKKPSVEEFNKNLEEHFPSWVIPAGLIAIIISFLLLFGLKRRKNKKPELYNFKAEIKLLNEKIKENKIDDSIYIAEQILNKLNNTLNEQDKKLPTDVKSIYNDVIQEIQLYRYASELPKFTLEELYQKVKLIINKSLK